MSFELNFALGLRGSGFLIAAIVYATLASADVLNEEARNGKSVFIFVILKNI